MNYTLPKDIENEIGKLICKATRAYFEDTEHRAAFEKWYLETYGKPYEWLTVNKTVEKGD